MLRVPAEEVAHAMYKEPGVLATVEFSCATLAETSCVELPMVTL